MLIPNREDYVWKIKFPSPNIDIWFTDGSRISNHFGAGVYGPSDNHGESIPMGSLLTRSKLK
jgi:hypothetical protein